MTTMGRKPADLAALKARRLRAAELFAAGWSQVEIAQELGATKPAVCQWHDLWKRRGIKGLQGTEKMGRRPRLKPTQLKRLEQTLLKGPLAQGYRTDWWTCPRIGEVIERKMHVRYDDSHVWRLLRKMGWSCQKPERRARERNEAGIQAWLRRQWPKIKKKGGSDMLVLDLSTKADLRNALRFIAPGRPVDEHLFCKMPLIGRNFRRLVHSSPRRRSAGHA
jgi:transposase